MEIKIPKKLETQLRRDKDGIWLSKVIALKARVAPLLENAFFFPDYTGHGADHINEVLANADMLIPAEALGDNGIDSRDTALLVSAVILHDLGMFLTCAGMTELVTGKMRTKRFEKYDEESWETAWAHFIDRTKRYPEEKMRYLFGTRIPVENTTLDRDRIQRFDRLVIGEFLRQHHGRLAHEIAVNGMPGSECQQLLEQAGFDETDRDLIGILARSHCMSLREVEQRLGTKTHLSGTPIFYLMSILRIADFLDAGEHRAPVAREKLEKIPVPLSLEEWTWNQCIKEDACRWDLERHERCIEANPKSSTQYVRLDTWLKDVQNELELCWSVLAQKYANDCKLSIHRVTCNIHDPDERKSLSDKFMTRDVRVTANPEIVKLMIEPLYGDDPTYGVRELLQNAVDACVERKEWEEKHGNTDYKGLVDIRIERKTHMEDGKPVVCSVFTITDNGMGMNEDILLNYYLSAGSSYRNSETWKAANAPDGTSRVARTGKFGVGFLAAFLLGDKIEVHTQHREDKKGYQFKFDQQSMPLDVKRDERTNPYAEEQNDSTGSGTTITIKLKREAIDGFLSDGGPHWYNWYAFDEPRVEYRMYDRQIHHKNLSLSRDPGDPGWLKLDTKAYETYLWHPNMETKKPEFYCNGIRIYGGYEGSLDGQGLEVYVPHVSLIDQDARLDVDLARKELKSIPEKEALFREVFRWHIARLLLTPWDSEQACRENLTLGFGLRSDHIWGRIPFLLSSGGFSLNYASVLSALSLEDYVILYYEGPDAGAAIRTARDFLDGVPCSIVVSNFLGAAASADYPISQYYYSSPSVFTRDLLHDNVWLYESSATSYRINTYTAAVWLREDAWKANMEGYRDPLPLTDASRADGIRTARFRDRDSAMPIFRDRFPIDEFPVAVHVIPSCHDSDIHRYADSLFVQTLKETLIPSGDYDPNDIWIPFKMDDREKKFPEAFEKLKDYIKHIRLEQEQEARRIAEEAARRKAEEARRKAEEAAQSIAEEAARRKAEKAPKFESFKSDRASDIAEFQNLLSQADPEALPQAFFSFLSQFVAAVLLDRPFLSIPEESVRELSELFRAQLGLDDEEITPDSLDADPEEIAEYLFDLCEDMDRENLTKAAEDNEDDAAILDALIRLEEALPKA